VQFRVLGGHQVESAGGRPTAFLIDDHIALDAGGLLSNLSIAQQDAIDTLIITHYHYDHIRDLPFLGLGAVETGRQIDVYCTQQVRDALAQHLMSAPIWPLNLFAGLDPAAPTFRHHAVVPGTTFKVGGYATLPVDNRHHAVPVIGYQFTSRSGQRLLYTGDTGPGIRDTWPLVEPDVLITEVTYPISMGEMGGKAGHLTPATLEQELVALREAKGSLPRVVVCHLNQRWESQIRAELEKVARRLQAPIEVAAEGMLIDL
jgi:ribonuclease BN (tRNA processing enzyme)